MKHKLINCITKEQFGLIIGCLLGDGSIPKRLEKTGNHYIDITHSEKQLEYLIYKKQIFEQCGFNVSKIYQRKVKSYKEYTIHIYHKKFPEIMNTLRWWFYHIGKKYFTYNMLQKLTPLGIAIWYMDDGSRTIHYKDNHTKIKSRELYLSTYMSKEEHETIIKYFTNTYNIKWGIVKDRDKFRLRIGATEAKNFINIIKPYICPLMLYKIDLQYNNLLCTKRHLIKMKV